MKTRINSVELFRNNVKMISKILEEAYINFDSDGLEIKEADPATVALVKFNLNEEAFSKKPKNSEKIGINIKKLHEILKESSGYEEIVLESTEGFLNVRVSNGTTKEFSLQRIDVEENYAIEESDNVVKAKMKPNLLKEGVDAVAVMGDEVKFDFSPAAIKIQSVEKGSKFLITPDEDSLESLQAEETESIYAIDFLQKMTDTGKYYDNLEVNVYDNLILNLIYKKENIAVMEFHMAPMIKD